MVQISTQPAAPPMARRSLPDVVIDRTWRFFCSVRAAVYEIVVLAVLVLLGTLRGSSVPNGLATLLPSTKPVVDRWYAWDVFHSLPFLGILTLLAIAIAICTINRAPAIWEAIAHPTVRTTRGFLANAETSADLTAHDAPAELGRQLTTSLQRSGYRVLTEDRGGEVHLYADRFRYAKLGTFPFHLALILILVGGIVGARYGFRDKTFIIPEGSVRELGHGTGLSVKLDDFSDTYQENGAPKEYRSDLTLLNGERPVKTGSLTVNHPLTYGNVVFYQSSFGQAVTLRITDAAGHVLYDDSLPLEFVSKLNGDAPAAVLDLPPAGVSLHVIAPDGNPANAPELDTLHLMSGQLYFLLRPLGPNSPLQTPIGAVGRQGSATALQGLSIDLVRERRFTLLQVGRNPGIPIFIAAAFLLVGGLAITFYFPHRRVRGIVAATGTGGSVVTLAPLARRDWSGQRAFERLMSETERRVGVAATLRSRSPAGATLSDASPSLAVAPGAD
jgi:cytochrome c biogenesis protein